MLQMIIHLAPHIKDDALADPGVDIAFRHSDDPG